LKRKLIHPTLIVALLICICVCSAIVATTGISLLRNYANSRAFSRPHEPGILEGSGGSIRAIAFAPDNRSLASAGTHPDRAITIWDLESETQVRSFYESIGVSCLAFSPRGELLASAGADGKVRMWDPSTGRLIQTLEEHTKFIEAIAFSADGRRIAA